VSRTYGQGDASSAPGARTFDWRRPSKFSREHVRSLAVAHEVFARRLASGLGSALGALVQLEPVSIDQVSYDDYIRSLPNPNVLAVVSVAPLPAAVLLELNVQLSLQLVDRLLGGNGTPVELRRPTEIEGHLIQDLMNHGVNAIHETLEPLMDIKPDLASLEFNPQLVQVVAPSDMVLLLAFRLSISSGVASEGLLTLCYPAATLAPLLDRLAANAGTEPEAEDLAALEAGQQLLTDELNQIAVELSVRLRDSSVAAGDLAALQVGDVLLLEHRADEPVIGTVGEAPLLEGRIGKRRRRVAFQVERWAATDLPTPATPSF
jgi:flagellar motor switch protein FliM